MITALYENEEKVNMYDDWQSDMYGHRFYCPACGSEVIPCRGNERRYFRHKSLNDCPFNEYEHEQDSRSIAHETMKRWLHDCIVTDEYGEFKNPDEYGFKCEYEKYISNGDACLIPDLYIEYDYKGRKRKFGFEIQKSKKSESKILEKNEKYKKLGVRYIWIGSVEANLSKLATVSGHKVYNPNYLFDEDEERDKIYVKGFYRFNDVENEIYWMNIMHDIDKCNEKWNLKDKKLMWFELTNKCCRENDFDIGTQCDVALFSLYEEPFVLWL